MEYRINPVRMSGLVKEITEEYVKIHIHGRLGVITIRPACISAVRPIRVGCELTFFFSYLRVTDDVFAVDMSGMFRPDPWPTMLYATITEVNDTAIMATISDGIGTVAVPLRFVFTDVPLKEGLQTEFWLSHMQEIF
ncbi:MAG: hypothetical protein LUF32_02580 [Clostridiales bacterium]|nr:hypothetical protein [Clostridiales bacterium]